MSDKLVNRVLFTGWGIAMIATFGSLFFSNVMGFVPCTLCWYQRIFMYPLTILFLLALLKNDEGIFRYAIWFIAAGFFIALYHYLIQMHIIPESASPCVQGVPCSARYINWFGFITIPFLSLTAFTLLAILLTYYYFKRKS